MTTHRAVNFEAIMPQSTLFGLILSTLAVINPQQTPAAAPPITASESTGVTPAAAVQDRTAKQATQIASRTLPPAPLDARVDRALAVAGLAGSIDQSAKTEHMNAARTAFAAWMTKAETEAVIELQAGIKAQPGSTLPRKSLPSVVARREDGLAFERKALEATLATLATGTPESAPRIALDVLKTLQLQAQQMSAGAAEDMCVVDLLEVALLQNPKQAETTNAADLRVMLAAYESERARLARVIADASLEQSARSLEVAIAVQKWFEEHRDANSSMITMPGTESIAQALQTAPLLTAVAEMVALQRRTALQLDTVLSPESSWNCYASLIAGKRKDSPTLALSALREASVRWPDEWRNQLNRLIHEFCTADRAPMQEQLALIAQSAVAVAKAVKPAAQPGSIAGVDVESINQELKPLDRTALNYQVLSFTDERMRRVNELQVKVAKLGEG